MVVPLKELFSDVFDPRVSFQLNNRYWPGERWNLIGQIADCEAALREGGPSACVRPLRSLRRHFPSDAIFTRLLHRIHRLHTQKSLFSYESGHVEVSSDALAANSYHGSEPMAVYDMARPEAFASVERQALRIYRREYGVDFLRVNRTVRFAMPSDRTRDVTQHGELSDFHNDEYKGISTIIYFSSVKVENGAFSFIEGSELIPRSVILTAIHQCVEFDMGLSGPEQLGVIPLEFRGSMAAGNYLDHDKIDTLCHFRRIL